jgi:hypothetical protein
MERTNCWLKVAKYKHKDQDEWIYDGRYKNRVYYITQEGVLYRAKYHNRINKTDKLWHVGDEMPKIVTCPIEYH